MLGSTRTRKFIIPTPVLQGLVFAGTLGYRFLGMVVSTYIYIYIHMYTHSHIDYLVAFADTDVLFVEVGARCGLGSLWQSMGLKEV